MGGGVGRRGRPASRVHPLGDMSLRARVREATLALVYGAGDCPGSTATQPGVTPRAASRRGVRERQGELVTSPPGP